MVRRKFTIADRRSGMVPANLLKGFPADTDGGPSPDPNQGDPARPIWGDQKI